MERSYSDFHPQAKEDIRSSIDENDDGDVGTSELEDFLGERGWTLGHFPQSFERASIGSRDRGVWLFVIRRR